jgi:hypothetical protein
MHTLSSPGSTVFVGYLFSWVYIYSGRFYDRGIESEGMNKSGLATSGKALVVGVITGLALAGGILGGIVALVAILLGHQISQHPL